MPKKVDPLLEIPAPVSKRQTVKTAAKKAAKTSPAQGLTVSHQQPSATVRSRQGAVSSNGTITSLSMGSIPATNGDLMSGSNQFPIISEAQAADVSEALSSDKRQLQLASQRADNHLLTQGIAVKFNQSLANDEKLFQSSEAVREQRANSQAATTKANTADIKAQTAAVGEQVASAELASAQAVAEQTLARLNIDLENAAAAVERSRAMADSQAAEIARLKASKGV
jgi:hypothetical protein